MTQTHEAKIAYSRETGERTSAYVVCADGGIVMRTTGNEWRCTLHRQRMRLLFEPVRYETAEDVPLVRTDGIPYVTEPRDEAIPHTRR